MPNFNIRLSKGLSKNIDQAIEAWGFGSRAEFFRYLAIDFLRNDVHAMPMKSDLKDYTKAIQQMSAKSYFANTPKSTLMTYDYD